jgi:hypothetical protein
MNWLYVDLYGVVQGPASSEELTRAFSNGKLKPKSLVWHPGMQRNEWKYAQDFFMDVDKVKEMAMEMICKVQEKINDLQEFEASSYIEKEGNTVYKDGVKKRKAEESQWDQKVLKDIKFRKNLLIRHLGRLNELMDNSESDIDEIKLRLQEIHQDLDIDEELPHIHDLSDEKLNIPREISSSYAPLRNQHVKGIFSFSQKSQIHECFRILDQTDLKQNFDEEELVQKNINLLEHRLAKEFDSSAANELNTFLNSKDEYTAILIGVSGCGKTHAIYKNALEKKCIYFTPGNRIMAMFVKLAQRERHLFADEDDFRNFLAKEFKFVLLCRLIVLEYLFSLSCNYEKLFFIQSLSRLLIEKYELLIYNHIKYYEDVYFSENQFFIAVDDCQIYFAPEFDNILRTYGSDSQNVSFNRFFSWFAQISFIKVVLSGTALKLRHIDRLGSGEKPFSFYGIHVISKFDYLDSTQIRNIVVSLIGVNIDNELLSRMCRMLRGRPQILMGYLGNCIQGNETLSFENFDSYCKTLVENLTSTGTWSLIKLWKDLFEGVKKDWKVNLSIKNVESFNLLDIHSCFLRILLDSVVFLDDKMDQESSTSGSWFTLDFEEAENIALGVCPIRNIYENSYILAEPLTIRSGLHFILRCDYLRSKIIDTLLSVMFKKGITPQMRGNYFELFVAMKLSLSLEFRRGLYDLALKKGKSSKYTNWISQYKVPDNEYFQIRCMAPDCNFLSSFESDQLDILLPSVYAGPDIQWWIFVFGIKTTWSGGLLSKEESIANFNSCDPNQFFASRSAEPETEIISRNMENSRQILNEKCKQVVLDRARKGKGIVRVRLELPYSNFENPDTKDSSLHDISLCLDLKSLSPLLSDEENLLFESEFGICNFDE